MQLPAGYVTKYQKLMGSKVNDFLASFQKPALSGFRINPLKAHPATDENLSHPIPWAKWGYYGQVHGRTVDHQSGAVYSQEPSAMYPPVVLNPEPDEKVLDLCAAPGSKTTYLASLMHNQGLLVANEIIPKRAKILARNVERFGLKNTMVTNEPPHKLARTFKGFFDKILVDAPCSGEGMFRKDPAAMQYWTPAYPEKCAERQHLILEQAQKMLKPGGILVYSTCTFSPEEDEQSMAWLVKNLPFKLLPVKRYSGMLTGRPQWADNNPELKKCVRIFPNHVKGEGHFIAKVQKADSGSIKKVKPQRGNVPGKELKLWKKFAKQNLINVKFTEFLKFGDQLYAINPALPRFKKLQIVSPGLHLGTFKKHRFQPAYALALALHPDQIEHHVDITFDQWKHYVHGETLSVNSDLPKGWYQLICEHQPIAFGKVVQGTIKNFFPKGLRFYMR